MYRVKRDRKGGFTLIELVVVIVIVAILAAIIVPRFFGTTEDAKQKAALSNITSFKTGLKMYQAQVGNYPTTAQGLGALIAKPDGVDASKWKGPYLDDISAIPQDPWGQTYHYESPGKEGHDFEIYTTAPDGTKIKSWQ